MWKQAVRKLLAQRYSSSRRRGQRRNCSLQLEMLETRVVPYAGALDQTFGVHGEAIVSDPAVAGQANAVAVQGDGKIIVAGMHLSGTMSELFLQRFKPDGTLDSSFNGTGVVTGAFAREALGLAIQTDGKIVVVGTKQGLYLNDQSFVVARYNANGTLDSSFQGGVVYTTFTDIGGVGYSFATSVAVQGDGKIVAAGRFGSNSSSYFALARYNADGTPDGTFNALLDPFHTGEVLNNFGGSASCTSVAIQADGRIVTGGLAEPPNVPPGLEFALARYYADGTLDPDFNANGMVTTAFGGLEDAATIRGVAIQADGKIIAVGEDFTNSGPLMETWDQVRYNPDGSLDASYGSGGLNRLFPTAGYAPRPNCIALQADGKAVVAGRLPGFGGGQDWALVRENVDGSLDNTFSFDGVTRTHFDDANLSLGANACAIQSDGKIVVAGGNVNPPAEALIRYNGDAGQLQFSAASYSVPESNGVAFLPVLRTGGSTGAVTVEYSATAETATPFTDFTPVSSSLTFKDGQTANVIQVPLLDDGGFEGGKDRLVVTLSNPGPDATLGVRSSAVLTILDPDMTTFPVGATEGASFSGLVARFVGSDPTVPAADYAATIDWGDGSAVIPDITPGTITADPSSGFDVSGNHTYAEEGSYKITVSIIGGDSITKTSTATVLDADLQATSVTPPPISVTGNKNFTGVVANFTDLDPAGAATDYTATITWDDNSTSAGTISGTGPFTVFGSHTFGAFNGIHTISVTIKDHGVPVTVVDHVKDPPASGADPNEAFVSQLYLDLLRRPAEEAGLAFWSGLLLQGASRGQIVTGVEGSLEYRLLEVETIFQRLLHRSADPTGSTVFADYLARGATVEQLETAVLASPEYFNMHGGTNEGFVAALYPDVFGRSADEIGQAAFVGALASGATSGQVAAAIFASLEYRQDLVRRDYQLFLHRAADPSGLDVFVAALAQGVRDEDVVADFLASEEYFAQL
jgi:uncharacterized delta-60 repeat protein